MPTSRAYARPAARVPSPPLRLLGLAVLLLAGACSAAETPDESGRPVAVRSPSASPPATRTPSPTASPTPEPTPRYTNEPDPELHGIIPETAGGATLVVPPITEFAVTPGDIGGVYGEIGDRFHSLALAYVEQPRTSLYAIRVSGEPVSTRDLQPYLAEAGRYVGIAGLDPEPWELTEAGGHLVWVRAEDHATAAGTHIYTWAAGEFVFLLIGVDDAVNRAIVAALPGEAPPTPTPKPSPTRTTGSHAPAPSPSAP